MRRYESTDIAHTASTDHRILRAGKPRASAGGGTANGDALPIISFYRDRQGARHEDDERDQAVAIVQLARRGKGAALRAVRSALMALERACRRDPEDRVALEAKGYALGLEERDAEALEVFQDVLAGAPDREAALVGAGSMAEAIGQTDAAIDYWRRAGAVNPWMPEYHRRLVLLLIKQEAWGEAGRYCQGWLKLDPFSVQARSAHVQCLLAAGNKEAARHEFARIVALAPANLRELQIRFEKRLR
jgi:tetratricopeptide (TPR) repeat protein